MGITNGHAHFSCSGNGAPNGALNKCETAGGNGRANGSARISSTRNESIEINSSQFRPTQNGCILGRTGLSVVYNFHLLHFCCLIFTWSSPFIHNAPTEIQRIWVAATMHATTFHSVHEYSLANNNSPPRPPYSLWHIHSIIYAKRVALGARRLWRQLISHGYKSCLVYFLRGEGGAAELAVIYIYI